MKQSYSLVTKINFLDLCECHLLPYYRTLNINKNNNTEKLTVMTILYLYDYSKVQKVSLVTPQVVNGRTSTPRQRWIFFDRAGIRTSISGSSTKQRTSFMYFTTVRARPNPLTIQYKYNLKTCRQLFGCKT